MQKNFMLSTDCGRSLYEEYAAGLPIIDYHNHLPVSDIAGDIQYENITRLWIAADPYKHRAMRILGVPEKFITGTASDFEKFEKWIACLPALVGNPLFDWSCMELSRVFGIELLPLDQSAEALWQECNEKLSGLTAKKILDLFHIEYSAPCTSVAADLADFSTLSGVAPSLRGDDLLSPDAAFVKKLEGVSGVRIASLGDYESALSGRLDAFIRSGCRFTDAALDDGFDYFPEDGQNESRFARLLAGETLSPEDRQKLFSRLLKTLLCFCYDKKLTSQLHIGAKRSTSSLLRSVAGPAGGYAAIGSNLKVSAVTALLDDAEKAAGGLAKTILLTLNPGDHAVLAALSGSFSRDGAECIVTQGPAWWWCDHRQGIRDMLENFSVYSVLSTFVGMTTDSRSLLSFVRHDYFRRILCDWIGEKAQAGIFPADKALLGEIVRKMCYTNAKELIK